MEIPSLQQALAANPVLLYFAAFVVGMLVFFGMRVVARTMPTLIQLIIGILAGVGVYFLLKNWIY